MVLRCTVSGRSKTTNLVETMERLQEENVTALGNLTFHFRDYGDLSTANPVLYSIGGSISLLCLLVTFVVYRLLPNFRNLHGSIVTMNIICCAFVTVYIIAVFNITGINSRLAKSFVEVSTLCKYIRYCTGRLIRIINDH